MSEFLESELENIREQISQLESQMTEVETRLEAAQNNTNLMMEAWDATDPSNEDQWIMADRFYNWALEEENAIQSDLDELYMQYHDLKATEDMIEYMIDYNNLLDEEGGDDDDDPFDPLVIDLNGDGIQLLSSENSNVSFSLTDENFSISTSWLSAEDGFLAIDNNQDGVINNLSELFGDNTQTGYEALSLLDSNNDGIISNLDEQYSELLVWQDANSDGVSQSEELFNLESLDIASISLTSELYDNSEDTIAEDGEIVEVGQFTYTDGSVGQTADINLFAQPSYSEYIGNYTLDEAVLAVADIKGYGTLADLHIAMSLDEELKNTVLNSLTPSSSITDLVDSFDDILISWANSQNVTLDDLEIGDLLSVNEQGVVEFELDVEGNEQYGTSTFTLEQIALIQAYAGANSRELLQTDYHGSVDLDWYGVATTADYERSWNELNRNLLVKFAVANGLLNEHLPGVTYDAETDLFDVVGMSREDITNTLDGVITVLSQTVDVDVINEQLLVAMVLTESSNEDSQYFTTQLSAAMLENPLLAETLSGTLFDISGIGGADNDVITGDEDTELLLMGNGGNDIVLGHDFNDQLYGGEGDDFVAGEGGEDFIDGGTGNDRLGGGAGNDTLIGGYGDDQLYGSLGNDTLYAGLGDDILVGGQGKDTMYAGIGNDILQGGDGQDKLYGEVGEDELYGGKGNDTLLGGADNDLLFGGNAHDKLYGQDGDDILNGDLGNDKLYGGDGSDTLNGGDGNDLLVGGIGADTLDGGDGIDTASYNSATSGVEVNMFNNNQNSGDAEGDILSNIENLTGSNFDDVLTGYHDDNTLNGQNGDDLLDGGNGNDILIGGEGDDYLDGGHQDDKLEGGLGDDTLIGGTGIDILNGDDGNDYLDGGHQDDILNGGNGNDTLVGDTGVDILNGGAGNDYLDGGHQDDELEGGVGDDTLIGGTGADILSGGEGNDHIEGGYQDDIITGGLGNDYLAGDGGNDTYLYSLGDGDDVISDNQWSQDELIFEDIDSDSLWFSQSGDDLVIGITGNEGSVTIDDWYLGSQYQIESIETEDGTLTSSAVNLLVEAMAGFEPPVGSGQVVTSEMQEVLIPVLAESWDKVA